MADAPFNVNIVADVQGQLLQTVTVPRDPLRMLGPLCGSVL